MLNSGSFSRRIRENEKLTEDEIKEIDEMLDNIPMSQVFGGSKVEK